MSAKMLYVAPLRDFSGYATAARNYVRALDSVGCELVTRSLHYDGGQHPLSEREAELAKRDLQGVDIIIQHTTPNETTKKPGVFNVNYFAWETDRVPDEWVKQINEMDLALVPCDENLKAARRSGVTIPIEKVEHTFDKSAYRKVNPFTIPGADSHFKFLSICQISKKKGLDALLKAYFAEFEKKDKTLLILKVYFSAKDGEEHRQKMLAEIQRVKDALRLGDDYPPVYLVHGVMDEGHIGRLYSTSDCYVLPSRGEGWGIPHFDAMGYGLPPIAVNWGGPTEFITEDCGWLTDFNTSPCFDMPHPHSFMYTGKDNWAEPHIDSLRSAMREAHQEWKLHQISPDGSRWARRIEACESRVEDFSYDVIGNKMKSAILKHYKNWKDANVGH